MAASMIGYIIIVLLCVVFVWFKNRKAKYIIPVLILVFGVFALSYLVDALFNTSVFAPFTIDKNGFTFSFVGLILWIAISLLAAYIIQRYINKR